LSLLLPDAGHAGPSRLIAWLVALLFCAWLLPGNAHTTHAAAIPGLDGTTLTHGFAGPADGLPPQGQHQYVARKKPRQYGLLRPASDPDATPAAPDWYGSVATALVAAIDQHASSLAGTAEAPAAAPTRAPQLRLQPGQAPPAA
jgi:hypothetical protein